MPYLGAGVDNHVNLTFTPTVIFVPTPGQSATARIYNEGRTLVYIGGAEVGQGNGLPLPPGSKPIEIINPVSNIYAVSYGALGAIAGTVGASSAVTNIISPGNATSTVTTAAAYPSTWTPGTIIGIGNTVNSSNLEFVTVATSVSTTALTTTVLYPHNGGQGSLAAEGLYPVTATYGQVRVTSGVV
jgi:hypothetical protein